MSSFDRVLLTVYTIFITILIGIFSAIMLGSTAPLSLIGDFLYPGRPEIFIPLAAFAILAGIRLFWISLYKPKANTKHVVLAEGAMGQVKVAISAIENLVEKLVSKIDGVREVTSKMFETQQGVGIDVRASVTPDLNVPAVSDEIQNRVKDRVYEVTGLTVSTVKVSIENISAKKPRVE